MRVTHFRLNWVLNSMRSRLVAGPVRLRAALDLRDADWRAQLRSLRERDKRQKSWRAARPLLVFAVAYLAAWSYLFITAFLGAAPPPTPLFVPGAVLFSAILLAPPRHWWRYLVVAFVIQVPILAYLHLPLVWNLVGFTPDAVEPIIAAALLRRYCRPFPLRFASLREVSIYTACVAVAVLIAATIGAKVNASVGGEPYGTAWVSWYLGDLLADLVLAPAILLWIAAGLGGLRPATGSRWRLVEAAVLYGGLLLEGLFVFVGRELGPEAADALIYLPVPLLLWAAVRFGPRGIVSALSLLIVLSIPAVANSSGPFASTSVPSAAVSANLLTLQLFLLVIGVPLFFLAALMQERSAAVSKLQTSEAQYRAVVETQTELITRYKPDTTLTFVNDATCRFDGKSREELLGTSLLADMPEESATRVRAMIERLLAQPDPGIETIEHEARYHDGTPHWQQWVNRTILDADGQVVELQGIGRDITDHKLMEEQLRVSEAQYRTVVRNLPHSAVVLFDANLRHSFADGPGLQALDLTPKGVEGRTVGEAFPADLAAALAPLYHAALAGREVALEVAHEHRVFHVQAVPFPGAMASAPAASGVNALPTPGGMVLLQDVTEQRRARDELERERVLATMLGALSLEFRTLADHSPDVVARLDPAGHVLYVNPAGAALLGQPVDQWIGKGLGDLGALGISQDVSASWAERLREVVTTHAPLIFDVEVPAASSESASATPQDHILSLHVRYVPELAPDGTLQSVLLIATDVSAPKRAEARLAEQAGELETIFEAQADGVGVYDLAGRFVRANMALRDLLGLDADATYATLPFEQRAQRLRLYDEQGETLPLEQWPQWRVLRGEILSGANAMEVGVHTLDGRDRWLSITGAPLRVADRSEQGQATGVVLVARDITVRRALERQTAEQAAELEAIFEAQADGVVVHDREGRMVRANRARQAMFQAFAALDERSADPTFAALSFDEQVDRWRQAVQGREYALRDVDGHDIPLEQTPTYRALQGETLTGANAVDERFDSADGSVYIVSVSAAPIRDAAGSIVGAVSVSRDVTTQRQLERQVREQASELAAIFETQADVVVVYDQQGRFVRGNRAWEDFIHQSADSRSLSTQPEFTALPVADQVAWMNQQIQDEHGQLIPVEIRPTARALRGETVTGSDAVDEWYPLTEGRDVLLSVSAAPMRDHAGHISGVVVVGRDVTARRQLERQVREQAAQLEATFAAMTDGVFVLTAQGHMTRINPAARALFKLTTGEDRAIEEVDLTAEVRASALDLGDGSGHSIPLEDLPTSRLLRGEVLTGDTALTLQFGAHTDHPRMISLTGGPLRDAATGHILGAVGVVRDVTELQRVQAALAEQERLFRTLVENSPDIIARFDRELRYRYVSPAIRQLSPLPETDYVGKTNAELGWPEVAYAPAQRAIEQAFQTGRPQTLEERTSASDDDPATARFFRAQFLPERAADGRVESVLTVTTDITALKRTEQALLAANASLERARQQAERRTRIAESLRGVLSMLNSKQTSSDVLRYIVLQAEDLLRSAAAVIYGPAQLTDSLSSAAQVAALRVQAAEGLLIGGRRSRPRQRLAFADPAIEQVLATAQPVALVDARGLPLVGHTASEGQDTPGADADADISHLDGELPAPYHALLVVPIRVRDGLYGCLLLFYAAPRRFGAEEVALAQAYADQVAQAITNARLQTQLEQEAAAAERNHLAQELHDTVKQDLFAAGLVAESLPAVWQTHRAEAEQELERLHAMTQSAMAGLHALLYELRPVDLERLPLAESLRQLAAAMSSRAELPIGVDVEGAADSEPPLPAAVKFACYRVAQEALTNAIKYAHAHSIRVRLRIQGTSRLELEIADDGRGFDPETTPAGHFGLGIMRDRAQGVGANVQVRSHPGQGTAVILTWRRGRTAVAPEREVGGPS